MSRVSQIKKRKRPTWDEYFLEIIDVISRRGTCDRGYAATVIVKDKRILTTGYVGAPPGLPHCDEVGHELREVNDNGTNSKHCIRTTHSEQNAIVQAAKFGISIDGSTLYTIMEPCYDCAKIIISAGIKRVVCKKKYHRAERTRDIFKQAGVRLDVMTNQTMKYKDM